VPWSGEIDGSMLHPHELSVQQSRATSTTAERAAGFCALGLPRATIYFMSLLPWRFPPRRRLVETAAVAVASLAVATLVIALLRATVHATFPAPIYLLAVLVVGMRYATRPAIATSVAAFLLYDFLFVQPLYTFTINSPDEWINLILLLAVSVAIGRLVAIQTRRAADAAARAREAEGLHSVTSVLAATSTVDDAAPVVVKRLCEVTAMDRVWVGLGSDPVSERVLADTAAGEPRPIAGWQVVLQRGAGGETHWSRAHVPRMPGSSRETLHRVRIEAAGQPIGSLWAVRAHGEAEPDRSETRILSAAADQLGQAIVRDRLAAEATTAQIARESEALKTALLDSVSHDLRTPLATIRAAAGSMLDRSISWSGDEQREAFETIDAEAERMGRLVRNLLDLSRIEGGALKPEMELAREAAARVARAGKEIRVVAADEPRLARVDEVFFGQILANLLENAVRYGGNRIEVRLSQAAAGTVEMSVQDDGRGVPSASLPRLFDKFYQVPSERSKSRRGMGIGLTVVAGLAQSMGAVARAEKSDLGGLCVRVDFPAVQPAPSEAEVEVG
jgi:two-component system sensor histidine kinase KdpD